MSLHQIHQSGSLLFLIRLFAVHPHGASVVRVSLTISTAAVEVKVGWRGVAIASTIIIAWAVSLTLLLSIEVEQWFSPWICLAVFWQMFLYTGLFITAHDAMHGVICPGCLRLNDAIGKTTLLLYGFLPYAKLLHRHQQHHQYPASQQDPDFHDGQHSNLLMWYLHFMQRYWGWRNLAIVIAFHHSVDYFLHVPQVNLILFWAVPSVLSSCQLFYFGTYLPHREPLEGYTNEFHAQSSYRPFLWSLLTCYHFGYHYEHHQHPDVPW